MQTSLRNLISSQDAAKILGVSLRTLERWRFNGKGPVFRKIGRRTMYAEDDLNGFIENARRTSTRPVQVA